MIPIVGPIASESATPEGMAQVVVLQGCPSWDRTRTLLLQRDQRRQSATSFRRSFAGSSEASATRHGATTRLTPGQRGHSFASSHRLAHRSNAIVERGTIGGSVSRSCVAVGEK